MNFYRVHFGPKGSMTVSTAYVKDSRSPDEIFAYWKKSVSERSEALYQADVAMNKHQMAMHKAHQFNAQDVPPPPFVPVEDCEWMKLGNSHFITMAVIAIEFVEVTAVIDMSNPPKVTS